MLKGSLQTVALPEVLNFLADTGKSGEFHVSGSNSEGRLWFDQGRISGIQVSRAQEPSEAIFELLRTDDGEFDFASDAERPEDARAVEADAGEVAPALEIAQAKLAEWRDIVAVVPSLAHGVQLRAETPAEPVTLEPEQWMMVVAIGAGRSVAEVIDARAMQEFDGCKAVRDLVEASLVEVIEPAAGVVTVEPEVVETFEPVAEVGAFAPVAEVGPEGTATTEESVDEHSHTEAVFSPFSFSTNGSEVDSGTEEGDHYAALRAAMVEIGDDLTEGEAASHYDDGSHPVYEFHADPEMDGRAALQALLSEVTDDGEVHAATHEPVDGLADRGPWTESELSTMETQQGDWSEDGYEVSNIVPFAPVQTPDDEPVAAVDSGGESEGEALEGEEVAPAEEPINRGLLLKFLSSVRN